jgi:S-adenosylmethionine decarboxylase
MAYNDALFQLGMDLTRSSTAQEEDLVETNAPVAHEDTKNFFTERDGVRFAGTHLIIDLFGAERLDDLGHVERTLKRCANVAGATLLHVHLYHVTPNGGVSGVAMLEDSHISIRSWPDADYAALDVFMCGDAKPHLVVPVLKEAFGVREAVVREQRRGEVINQVKASSAARKKAPIRLQRPEKTRRVAAA